LQGVPIAQGVPAPPVEDMPDLSRISISWKKLELGDVYVETVVTL
jgi:hypothetical protein